MIRILKIHKYAVAAILLIVGVAFYFAACAPAPSRLPKKQTRFKRKECLECHTQFADTYLTMNNVHAVVKEKKCEDCHLRHGIVPKLLLKKEGNQVCFACHDKTQIGMDQSKVHSGLQSGQCVDCHNPHASNENNLLKARGSDVCYQCHQKENFSKAVRHQPIDTETCLRCHFAHSSAQPGLLKDNAGFLYEALFLRMLLFVHSALPP